MLYCILLYCSRKNNPHFNKNISTTAFINSCQDFDILINMYIYIIYIYKYVYIMYRFINYSKIN